MYDEQIRVVSEALETVKAEAPTIFQTITAEGRSASTGLEYYGIIASQLKLASASGKFSQPALAKIRAAVSAVAKMYGNET